MRIQSHEIQYEKKNTKNKNNLTSKWKHRNVGIKPPVSSASQKRQNNYSQLRPVLFVRLIQLIVAVHFAWELLWKCQKHRIKSDSISIQKRRPFNKSKVWGVDVYCMQIKNSWYVHLFFEPVFIHFGSIIICFFFSIIFLWLLCQMTISFRHRWKLITMKLFICVVCLVAFSEKYSMWQNSIEFITSLGKHMHDAWIFNFWIFHWYFNAHTFLSLVFSHWPLALNIPNEIQYDSNVQSTVHLLCQLIVNRKRYSFFLVGIVAFDDWIFHLF